MDRLFVLLVVDWGLGGLVLWLIGLDGIVPADDNCGLTVVAERLGLGYSHDTGTKGGCCNCMSCWYVAPG